MDGWKPLATLAREAGVPEASARRYAEAFAVLVRSRRVGKAMLYAPEVGTILKAAADGFAEGLRREEVAEKLALAFGRVHDVAPGGDDVATTRHSPSSTPASMDVPAILAALTPLADRFVSALEKAAEALAILAARGNPEIMPERQTSAHTSTRLESEKPPRVHSGASRDAILAEVRRLRAAGLGRHSIAKEMRLAGWPTLSGRGTWAKGAVARILKGEVK